jgi:hypothetical protein
VRDRRSTWLALGVFTVAALAATWPLVLRAGHAAAGGDGDPVLVSTVLAWDADRLAHGLRGFWDAPWLFPYRHSLAYSEHLIGVALFTAPVQWITGNPFLAYNAAYIGSYALAGFGMFLLTRALWGRTDAALLAGLAFELTPYRLAQSSHLQVLMNGWMPIALLALHRYFASGRRRWLAAFTAAFIVLGLSNGYYLYFFLLPIGVVGGVELARRPPTLPRRRMAFDLTAAGVAVAAAIAPMAFVYYRLQREHGFTRTIEQLGLSAGFADYFHVASGAWTWGGLLAIGKGELELFQGFVVLAFAALGIGTIGQRGRTRLVATYLAIGLLAVWLAMGPGPWTPYAMLFRLLPGFSALRVPARMASVFVLAIAVLAGAGFASVLARLPKRGAAALVVIIAALILVEGQHGVGLTEMPNPNEKSWDAVAYDWLRASPPGAVIELNVTQLDDVRPFTIAYQFHALTHRHPIVNGYGGWKSTLQELFGSYASPLREPGQTRDAMEGLRTIGVRYVLLHAATFVDPADAARAVAEIRAAGDQIAEQHEWPGVWAWRLKDVERTPPFVDDGLKALDPRTFEVHASGHEERLPLLFDGDIDTRWISGDPQDGGEWIEIRFPHEVDLARIQFETTPRSVTDYPRRLAIDSADEARTTRTLFEGGVAGRLIASLAVDELHAPVTIDLPRNRTATLRIRQRAHGTTWWAVHELRLWEQAEERSR